MLIIFNNGYYNLKRTICQHLIGLNSCKLLYIIDNLSICDKIIYGDNKYMSKIFDISKTIVAISTPIGVGGISVVRMTGDQSIEIADKLFCSLDGKKPSEFASRVLNLGRFIGDIVKDKCLCVVFRAPNSFTGENLVEFQCHGGIKLTELILNECIKKGAVLAENGEFSLRAFNSGKMSLSEAEGMIDLINAESEAEISAGYNLMEGGLTHKIDQFQRELVDIMGEIEVSFDYPEEDIEYTTIPVVKKRLTVLNQNIKNLIGTSHTGSIIKNGINAVIVGKPNVGKSSLLNALINKQKAIVTNIAGTTRDIIEDAFSINGVKVNIIDTAGIHSTIDKIEKIGVNKSLAQINKADIILFVVDGSESLSTEDEKIYQKIRGKKHIVVINKIDKKQVVKPELFESCFLVSAKNKKNIESLKQKIYDFVIDKNIIGNSVIITSARHNASLIKAFNAIDGAIRNINNVSLDLIAIDLNEAFSSLGEITGTSSNEVILDSIFSKFCLGK